MYIDINYLQQERSGRTINGTTSMTYQQRLTLSMKIEKYACISLLKNEKILKSVFDLIPCI